MAPPLIAITTYAADDEEKFPLPRQYVDSVRRAGGLPLLVPPGESRLDELLTVVDGLILAGGGDVDPQLYQGQPHESVYHVDVERDRMEIELVHKIIDSGLPTLAICRGIQIVNVALGGTLHPHLPDVVGETILHRLPPRVPTEHQVAVEGRSRLARLLSATEFSAASWHHQAVRDPAPPLVVVAHAPDGTIEALEHPGHPWLIAVQWHPELTSARDSTQQRLFDALILAADSARAGEPA